MISTDQITQFQRASRRSPFSARRAEKGYNLVEVLIAMAVLSSVLISVFALFVMGSQNVYSGKQMTRAVAVGNRITEDLTLLTRPDIQRVFNLATATPGNVTVAGQTYANSVLRLSTDTTNDTGGYLARWHAFMSQQNFTDGLISLVITPVDPLAGGTPSMTASPIYRIRVYVQWTEKARRRSVVLDVAKVDRTN
jgi:prepilin-type N-terminal cleavage/methylation domain-containing protein